MFSCKIFFVFILFLVWIGFIVGVLGMFVFKFEVKLVEFGVFLWVIVLLFNKVVIIDLFVDVKDVLVLEFDIVDVVICIFWCIYLMGN